VVFTLIAWWRLLRIGPGRRRPLIGSRARRLSQRRQTGSPRGQDAGVSRAPLAYRGDARR
jgi:hypothetical protein